MLRFPNETDEVRQARERVLEAETRARRAVEEAAAARRALPISCEVAEDYRFRELDEQGEVREVHLSELFGTNDSLIVYSYMFGPEKARPCPMCTPLLQGLSALEHHIRPRVSLVAVAESPPARLRDVAAEFNLQNLRLLCSAGTTYNRDYGGTTDEGDTTMWNTFVRREGKIYHFWGSLLVHTPEEPDMDHRAGDLFSPIFAAFDLTPEGRGDHYCKLTY